MEKKVAFLFPGQGESHYIGMGKDFYDRYPESKAVFEQADDILGFKLSELIFSGSLEELTETQNCQVALYVNSIAILRAIEKLFPDLEPYACSGLSLGEYSAATATGRLSFEDGVCLVRKRGELMQAACRETSGSMAVVLGLAPADIENVICNHDLQNEVFIANLNCPGQTVISGSKLGIEKAIELIKSAGAKRALPLNVIGAFHSPLMNSAKEGLKPFVEKVVLHSSKIRFVMNVSGQAEDNELKIKNNLVDQVTTPVYWEKGIRHLEQQGVTHYLEIGCGKVLTNLNKRIKTEAPTLSIDKIEDLDKLSEFIDLETPAILGG